MAEYNEVIKQFKRMCRYTNHSGLPNECPLYCKGHGCNISHCRLLAFEDKKFQSVVMAWAAEHPEPVYPTWEEWLQSVGVMESSEGLLRRIKGQLYIDGIPAHAVPTAKVLQPMDADIAQKLGIEPKEG